MYSVAVNLPLYWFQGNLENEADKEFLFFIRGKQE
jgi:hypothetical protein